MLTILRLRYGTLRMFTVVACLLMFSITVSYAQEDIDTTTYEDDENGITFEYPATWTEIDEFEEDSTAFVDTFASDDSAGMSVIVAESGAGQTVVEQLQANITVAEDTETADYAGATFTVYNIETPDFNEGVGYLLFTEDLSYDLLIAVLANDGALDDYLDLITSTLVLPEADSDEADIDTTTYEDDENGISLEYPSDWTEEDTYTFEGAYGFNLFAEDDSSGMSVLVADSGEGQAQYDEALANVTVLSDEDTVDYAGVTFTVVAVQAPDLDNGTGYLLFTEEPAFDLLIGIIASDGMEDDYLDLITSTLVLPEADSDEADIETSTYEDEENGITFAYPSVWTQIEEYGDDISSSVDIIMPDESAGVTVIVAESGEGQTIVDEIDENITIEDDTTTADYAGVTFTVFMIEVPDFEDEDGKSGFGYLLFAEDLSYDLLIGIITSDGMEDNYLDIIMNTLVLPEAPTDDDSQQDETDASETASVDGLIFAEEFNRDDVGDNLILTVDESGEPAELDDYILVDMDGTAYIQLEEEISEIQPYLAFDGELPENYEVETRMRLASSPETLVLIDVSSVGTQGELATIELDPDFLRMGDYVVEIERLENLLDSSFSPPERDTWFELRITVEGNEVTVFVDGVERLQADDFAHIDENFIGVFVTDGIVDIDYIRVYELED